MTTRMSAVTCGMITGFSLLLTCNAQAGGGRMTEEQMQQMMENAQKMQECMASIDQSAMNRLQEKGRKMQAEIKALCAAGKRKEAEKAAIAHGKEVSASKEMKEMQKCGEMAKGMTQQMPMVQEQLRAEKGRHICDDM